MGVPLHDIGEFIGKARIAHNIVEDARIFAVGFFGVSSESRAVRDDPLILLEL